LGAIDVRAVCQRSVIVRGCVRRSLMVGIRPPEIEV
jgi:hypothetical protein